MNSVCTICCDGCKEHGERVERDRIIELLKKFHKCDLTLGVNTCFDFDCENDLSGIAIVDLITLIKGEK